MGRLAGRIGTLERLEMAERAELARGFAEAWGVDLDTAWGVVRALYDATARHIHDGRLDAERFLADLAPVTSAAVGRDCTAELVTIIEEARLECDL